MARGLARGLGHGLARGLAMTGAMSGFVAVAAGAFGAHALRGRIEPRMLDAYDVAVRYQMIHALAILAAAWMCGRSPGRWSLWSGRLFLAGSLLFSGSLYAMALGGPRWLGAVTPLGGSAFLAGWILLALAAWRMEAS
jgi:uncharacterized membrane protein YgdD (TMEM256/DUF423 family)